MGLGTNGHKTPTPVRPIECNPGIDKKIMNLNYGYCGDDLVHYWYRYA